MTIADESTSHPDVERAVGIRGLRKTYDGQVALDGVSFDVPRGAVTGLLGHNGSGKSTLIKILAGVVAPDPTDASVEIHGRSFHLPATENGARAVGLHFVHQDLGLVGQMTIEENMGLYDGFAVHRGLRILDRREAKARTRRALETVGLDLDPDTLIRELAPAEQSLIAIARMMFRVGPASAPILVLDEPTASLAEAEVNRLFELIRGAVDDGATCIYVTHRLGEIDALADHVVVLRDGRTVLESSVADCGRAELVDAIVGDETASARPTPTVSRSTGARPSNVEAANILSFTDVSGPRRVAKVSFTLAPGEILGVTGLLGSGKSELARIAAGVERPTAGAVQLLGSPFVPKHPREASRRGVGYVPQDRHAEGLLGALSVRENLALPVVASLTSRGLISRTGENDYCTALIRRVGVRPPRPEMVSGDLSGGNQQKVVVARNLRPDLKLLVVDELSQGIDVGTRADLYALLRELASRGIGVLIASSDQAELCEVATRVLILDRGQVVRDLPVAELDEDSLVREVLTASEGVTT